MRALNVSSTCGNLVAERMRDETYLRHLRQVEKINNRQAHHLSQDLKEYHSINEPHLKRKLRAFQWQHREQEHLINSKNQRLLQKIKQIRPYTHFKQKNRGQQSVISKQQSPTPQQESSPAPSPPKKGLSLHYQYRKRRQQQIDRQNMRLQKCLGTQKSSYLPKLPAKMSTRLSPNPDQGQQSSRYRE